MCDVGRGLHLKRTGADCEAARASPSVSDMRERVSGAFILLTIGAVPCAAAQEIFKCVGGTETAYQSIPCSGGAEQTRIAPIGARAGGASPPSARPSARRSGPWKHSTLTLGMSDDEVLNMSGWGRPTRINRVRLPREWREEWVYGPETL